MTQAVQQAMPAQHNGDDASAVEGDLVFQSLFGFDLASAGVPKAAPTPAGTATQMRPAKTARQAKDMIGKSVRKLFADGKRYKGTVKEHNVVTRRVVVVYEDGDEERMSVNQLKHFLVPDDPETGRKKAPAPSARSPAQGGASRQPPAEPLAETQADAAQPAPPAQPQETASDRAQVAVTIDSLAPGGGSTSAAPEAAGAADAPAPAVVEMKPQTVPAPSADQRQAIEPVVPQLPPAGSSLRTVTSSGHVRGHVQAHAPQDGVATTVTEGQAASDGSQLRMEAAAPPPGDGAPPSGSNRRKMASPRRVSLNEDLQQSQPAAPQGLGLAGILPPAAGKRTASLGAPQRLTGFEDGADPTPLDALSHIFGPIMAPAPVPAASAAATAPGASTDGADPATDRRDDAAAPVAAAAPAVTAAPGTKFCVRCGKERPVSDFWRAAAADDGLQRMCIPCHNSLRSSAKKPRASEARSSEKRSRSLILAIESEVPSPAKPAKAAHSVGNPPEAVTSNAASPAKTELLAAAAVGASAPVANKTCSGCHLMKLKSHFWKHARNADGVQSRCIACLRMTSRSAGKPAQQDGAAAAAADEDADGSDAHPLPLALPLPAGTDSPLAALAAAAAEDDGSDLPPGHNTAAAADAAPSATRTVMEPGMRRRLRNEVSSAEAGGAEPPGRSKRAAAPAAPAETPAPKRRAVDGLGGGPAALSSAASDGATKTVGGIRTQQCRGCLQVKPLADFYKARR